MTIVTVDMLAASKRLQATRLREFGLSDQPYGVRFEYRALDGNPGRPRRRTGLRGAGGSMWEPDCQLPIVPYVEPGHRRAVAAHGYLLVVEGESDCWTGWSHGVPVLGVPGADQWRTLRLEHLEGADAVFLQREPVVGATATFPQGIDAYLDLLSVHLRSIGYVGEIRELRLTDGVEDLSGLHCLDEALFDERLAAAMAQAGYRGTNP